MINRFIGSILKDPHKMLVPGPRIRCGSLVYGCHKHRRRGRRHAESTAMTTLRQVPGCAHR